MRFVIRPPSISTTPRLLAQLLRCRTRRYPSRLTFRANYATDLFLTYPPPEVTDNQPDVYPTVAAFFATNKFHQRIFLRANGVPTPEGYGSRYEAAYARSGTWIVRPLRHSGGRNYQITDDPTQFHEGHQYVSRVFPKDAEYRLIFVFGDPLLLLKKLNPNNIPADQPWNHAQGCSFSTLSTPETARIFRVGLAARLAAVPIIKFAHIAAIDILWSNREGPSVCEINACPGLSIPANLEKVANHVSHRYESTRPV